MGLVWLPDNPDDTITRLLFPGSTPQNKVLRGLDKLKDLEFMQKPVCASRSVMPKQNVEKGEPRYPTRSTSRRPKKEKDNVNEDVQKPDPAPAKAKAMKASKEKVEKIKAEREKRQLAKQDSKRSDSVKPARQRKPVEESKEMKEQK